MAAGSLCGIIITPLLIGSPLYKPVAVPMPLQSLDAAGFNCSVIGSDFDCITGFNGSTLSTTTRVTTTTITTTNVDELLNQVSVSWLLKTFMNFSN